MSASKRRGLLLGVILLAFAWRAAGLFANSYQPDEALFASFARNIAVWRDPLLLGQPVDKPPLLFYAQSIFYPLFGPVEWAARLPNFIASLLSILLAARLAWRWFGDNQRVVLTAFFLAFSPLAVQFSPTAFTDPLLTGLLLATFVAAAESRLLASGLLFGLALATKYQALLFLPLLLAVGVKEHWRGDWARWLAGAGMVGTAVLFWQAARMDTISLWQTQLRNFGGIRLIWSWELWPRFGGWATLWGQADLIIASLAALSILIWRRLGEIERVLALFLGGYFIAHWLLAIPIWDRYLLPVLPLMALLASRTLFVLTGSPKYKTSWISGLIIYLLLLGQFSFALKARDGRFPLGSFPGADHGAAEVAEFLADEPYGTVLYDHWFSWEWRYHLFDKKIYVDWFPDTETLITDLIAFADQGGRYLVLPDNRISNPVRRAVSGAGFQLHLVYTTRQQPGLLLYQITR